MNSVKLELHRLTAHVRIAEITIVYFNFDYHFNSIHMSLWHDSYFYTANTLKSS